SGWRDPFWCATAKHRDDVEAEKAMAILDEAMCAVLERHGIDVQAMLACEPKQLLLAEAA
ncbi:MAG: hypothetical protein ACOYYI_04455, partial [Chloroflexota bacterium]